jgi:hypothetical protein
MQDYTISTDKAKNDSLSMVRRVYMSNRAPIPNLRELEGSFQNDTLDRGGVTMFVVY